MPRLLKVSSQGQVTLPRAIRARMGNPSHLEAELVKGDLVLRKGLHMTLDEAELAFSKHGLTRAVLQEALRITARREREAKEAEKPA